MKKEETYYMPYRKETFEPISLELPLPTPEYYEQRAPKEQEKPEVERGVWTIDIS